MSKLQSERTTVLSCIQKADRSTIADTLTTGRIAAIVVSSLLLIPIAQADEGFGGFRNHQPHDIETGMLFLNGEFVAPPYVVESTEDAVILNGIPLRLEVRQQQRADDEGRRPGRWRGTERNGGEFAWGNRWARVPNGSGRFQTMRIAREVSEALNDDVIVLAFDETPIKIARTTSEEFAVAEAIVADSVTPELLKEFLKVSAQSSETDVWTEWLHSYVPPKAVSQQLQARMQVTLDREAAEELHLAAIGRLETFSYPLTIVGMLLGVFALGHMLQWTGKGLTADATSSQTPEAVRYVIVALLLMLAMSTLDLVWTVLAGEAGIMKEVNPLAARYIHSPKELALFKVVATSIGLGILFIWRHRRQIQQATWWLCLICVLLTFRWIVVDSLMS